MLRELSGLPLMDCNEAPGMVNAVKFTLYLNSIGLIFLVSRLGRPWPGFDLGQELSWNSGVTCALWQWRKPIWRPPCHRHGWRHDGSPRQHGAAATAVEIHWSHIFRGKECVRHREEIASSGKRTFQSRIDAIIERLSRRAQEDVTSNLAQKMSPIPASPPKSIFVVDFYSGAFLFCIYDFVFIITTQLALERFP